LDTYFDDLGERQRRAATALRQINEKYNWHERIRFILREMSKVIE